MKLKNVRLSFPNLFTATSVNAGEARFSASFLFAKDHPAAAEIRAEIHRVAEGKWGDKAAEIVKALAAKDMLCLHDGDTKSEYEGYAGNYCLNAANKVRPLVLDSDKSPLTEADGAIYSGCYVNAIVELWAQDNQYGKRINASLSGVQFCAHGDAFSAGRSASADDFDISEGATAEDLI